MQPKQLLNLLPFLGISHPEAACNTDFCEVPLGGPGLNLCRQQLSVGCACVGGRNLEIILGRCAPPSALLGFLDLGCRCWRRERGIPANPLKWERVHSYFSREMKHKVFLLRIGTGDSLKPSRTPQNTIPAAAPNKNAYCSSLLNFFKGNCYHHQGLILTQVSFENSPWMRHTGGEKGFHMPSR